MESVQRRMSRNGDKKEETNQKVIMIKDTRVEIVKKETKIRYMLILQERLETIKKMKEDAEQLEGELREWWRNEMLMAERRIDLYIKRVSDMIVVGEDGEIFASE